jgi:Leucine-rich repeat (LRR) protein
LNLSGNQIEEVDMTSQMKSLMELNLRGNKIREIRIGTGIKGLKEIQFENLTKMYLSNNQIKNFDQIICCKLMLANLGELTIENNPIEKEENLK